MTEPTPCTCCAEPGGRAPQINIELLRESLRIMRWHSEVIDFIVAAVEEKNVRG